MRHGKPLQMTDLWIPLLKILIPKSSVEARNPHYSRAPLVILNVRAAGELLAWDTDLRQAPSHIGLACLSRASPFQMTSTNCLKMSTLYNTEISYIRDQFKTDFKRAMSYLYTA